MKKNICNKCGAELQAGQIFCSKCGQKAGLAANSGTESSGGQVYGNIQNSSEAKKKKLLPVGIAAAVVIIFLIIIFGHKKDFSHMYSDIADEAWCTIAEDGTWMRLDTNPNDIEDAFNSNAYYKIESVLKDLGFSSYVLEEMKQTTGIMGRQSASADDYEVTWLFGPDCGLEVTFRIDD